MLRIAMCIEFDLIIKNGIWKFKNKKKSFFESKTFKLLKSYNIMLNFDHADEYYEHKQKCRKNERYECFWDFEKETNHHPAYNTRPRPHYEGKRLYIYIYIYREREIETETEWDSRRWMEGRWIVHVGQVFHVLLILFFLSVLNRTGHI